MSDSYESMQGEEVRQSIIKFGKIGDWFMGTLVDDTRRVPNRLNPAKGEQVVYRFKIISGSWHDIKDKVVSETPTVVLRGEVWSYFGNTVTQDQMRNAKIGQIVAMKFKLEKPPTQPGYNPTKVIAIKLGAMDDTYQGELEDVDMPV